MSDFLLSVSPPPGAHYPENAYNSQENLHPGASAEGDQDSDIFRGRRSSSPQGSIRTVTPNPSSPSSSNPSSASLNVGRRLGALANVVEQAIARWARANSSSSSSTSSESSSKSVGSATTRTTTVRKRHRRRQSSAASLHNAYSERAILARKKAREEFRVVAHEYVLLLPPTAVPALGTKVRAVREQIQQQRTIRTTSFPLIRDQLESALRKSAKLRRMQTPTLGPTNVPSVDVPHHSYMLPDVQPRTPENNKKGKQREAAATGTQRATTAFQPPFNDAVKDLDGSTSDAERGWWLDVSSPTWEDLRELGKILHLHPLTLEDILHQEPREKLEVFPKLGYYFVVFRALEGEQSRQRFRRYKTKDSEDLGEVPIGRADEGVIGAVNVYLVIFREGICSFHFEDISEHADKVRNKVLQLEGTVNMSSDWIAHGILDSIVDSFFPIVGAIEKEVEAIDALIIQDPQELPKPKPKRRPQARTNTPSKPVVVEMVDLEKKRGDDDEPDPEKAANIVSHQPSSMRSMHTRFALPPAMDLPVLRRIRRYIRRRSQDDSLDVSIGIEKPQSTTAQMLLRMTATRRIVTSLGRLLATKGEVITQIRKRLLAPDVIASANTSLSIGIHNRAEVAYHLGDVKDHILALQQSLAHYERMLSHSHPAYLARLRVSFGQSNASREKALVVLPVISLITISMQLVISIFSINVTIPSNTREPGHPLTYFYSITVFTVFVTVAVLALVHRWRMQAKRNLLKNI